MQQMKTRSAIAIRLMAFIFVTSLAVAPAFGQFLARAEIPYEFTLDSKVLPAGTYTFSVISSGLRVQSAGGQVFGAPIVSRLSGPAQFLREGTLVFDKTGGGHILSEVWMPRLDGILLRSTPINHTYEVLLISALNDNSKVSGKAAYDQTCGRCHGPAGKGDEKADKFFKVTIPRLRSAEVQGKSDSELREIITKGTSTMPPVEIDDSGFRHRLPPQLMDAVIAYVRTLKQ
jgi:cytochrome c5